MTEPMLLLVPLADDVTPIEAGRLEDGRRGATMRSLCTMLEIARNGQIVRIRRNPKLAQALVSMRVHTPGGTQRVDILLDWAIPIWAAGLNVSRLPEAKRAAAAILQQYAFAAIERAFAQFDSPASTPPPPSQAPAPQSPWDAGHMFIDSLEADQKEWRREVHTEQQELHSRVARVEHEQHAQALRLAALEVGDVRSTMGAFSERLSHIYVLTGQLRQRQGYRIADTLAGLADHFRVKDISDLTEKDWPAVLVWFESLLEN